MKRASVWLAAALALLGLACARVLLLSREELRLGRSALLRNDAQGGVRHLRRSAHLYLPWSPYPRAALAELEGWARGCEVRGQDDRALVAWRAVRASARGVRWLWSPYQPALERADRRIAYWMAQGPAAPDDQGVPPARREELYLAQLTEDRRPEPVWVLVQGLGLLLWVGTAVWASRGAFTDEGRLTPEARRYAGGALALGLGLFVLGLVRA
ncbi:MAG: hypothetical protein HY909_12800 [Deltaproteobacteria bacterium]|nr:hypothetical protein [Deltaproteobacteria bacterium]